MYGVMLALHSAARWIVLILGLWTVIQALGGWLGRKPWGPKDDRLGSLFVISVDAQFLLGLLLYLLFSPIIRAAFADFGQAMRAAPLRFWAVEHLTTMVLAVALAHIGRVRARRATDSVVRHRLTAIFLGVAVVAMLFGTPWPGTPNGRPLFRLP